MNGLRQKRKERELPLRKVAKAMGVTLNTIFNYEHGKRFPDRAMLQKLAAFFECAIDELM